MESFWKTNEDKNAADQCMATVTAIADISTTTVIAVIDPQLSPYGAIELSILLPFTGRRR